MNTEYNDNREYKNALDGLRFSEEAKARMAKRLMDTMERPEQAPETRRRVRRLPRIAVIGVAAAFICLQIFGADSFVLPSMLLIVLVLFVGRTRLEREGARVCR